MHLLDAVELHVEQARERANRSPEPNLAKIALADARCLDYPNRSVDAVLLLGPLYHLTSAQDRAAALTEAFRVLRPGGKLLAVAVNRFIPTINGLVEGTLADPVFRRIIDQALAAGQHRYPEGSHYLTTAYFCHPNALERKVVEAGFSLEALLAVEGPAELLSSPEKSWSDAEVRQWLLDTIRRVERERCLFGPSTHIMAIAVKP